MAEPLPFAGSPEEAGNMSTSQQKIRRSIHSIISFLDSQPSTRENSPVNSDSNSTVLKGDTIYCGEYHWPFNSLLQPHWKLRSQLFFIITNVA